MNKNLIGFVRLPFSVYIHECQGILTTSLAIKCEVYATLTASWNYTLFMQVEIINRVQDIVPISKIDYYYNCSMVPLRFYRGSFPVVLNFAIDAYRFYT